MPTSGKAAARTALPQPPKTSQAVSRNSAASFLVIADSFMGRDLVEVVAGWMDEERRKEASLSGLTPERDESSSFRIGSRGPNYLGWIFSRRRRDKRLALKAQVPLSRRRGAFPGQRPGDERVFGREVLEEST
jgi:hypothetical protein